MRIKLTPPKDDTQWHEWFAWHPIKLGNEIIWLEKVTRRVVYWDYGWYSAYERLGYIK